MKNNKSLLSIMIISAIFCIAFSILSFVSNQNYDLEFAPYIHWKAKHQIDLNINISTNGYRMTYHKFGDDKKQRTKTIWMFGGSTLFCPNVSDNETVSSYLAQEFNKTGNYYIYNYGQSGFIVRQQLYYLINLLIEERRKPDIVIFYDGVNDILNTARNGKAGALFHQEYREKDFRMSTSLKRIVANYSPFASINNRIKLKITPEETAILFDKEINAICKMIYILSKTHNFGFYHFQQPTVFTKKNLDPLECEVYNKYETLKTYFDNYHIIDAYSNLIYMQDIFDNTHKQIFEDFCHVNAKGNEIIAKKMAEIIFENESIL